MNQDFQDFLRTLLEAGVRFLVVGAHALAVHGVPRATVDLDVWIERTPENADRVWHAMQAFGAPLEALGIARADLERPQMVIQIGVAPRRIDVLTDVSGVGFEAAWADRTEHFVGSIKVPFMGRRTFIINKRATGRTKDLADLEELGEA